MASSRNLVKGRENLNDGITVNMLGLQLVMGNIVLSLRPGGGDALTRGLNEVRRKINGGAHKIAKWLSYVVKESRVQIRFL